MGNQGWATPQLVETQQAQVGQLQAAIKGDEALIEAAQTQLSYTRLTSEGRPWTPDGFRASWGKACIKAGISGLTFNDLRGTAVTRLALVGCTEAQIASITGHSLRDVHSILDAHYLHRDPALAESAITKLEMGYATRTAM